jgi:hypothetical protein
MFGLTKFDIAALEQAYAGTGEQTSAAVFPSAGPRLDLRQV